MLFTGNWLLSKLGPTHGRGALNTKRAPALKKGYGSIGLGRHTNKGFFIIDTRFVPQFHVPEPNHAFKPYVSRNAPVINKK
jgi:large subunit ribosomal protein L41